MGAVEEDLEMEEINWMMRIPWYIVIGALVGAYWQKSNKDVPFGKRYILKEAYWKWYILRTYPLAEQGTGRTRRAVGGAQIRGMVHRGAFQALPNMVEMQEGCARDAQIFADPTTTSTRTRPPTPVRAALTMDTMIHDVVARGGLQKRHRGQQFSQVPPA